jgi:site-specific DNA recombinase
MAKNYVDNLSEEVKKGMTEKAAQGTYPSWAPYGYLNAYENSKKFIKVDPSSAAYVKKMFELYATGSYSLLTLHKKMLSDGMIYRNGKPFYRSTLENILKNIFYTGSFSWKGKRYDHASHEAIVSPELFQQVQRILINPHKSKSRKGLFHYSNMIKCGLCGCRLTAEIKKGKYIYYHCTGKKGDCKQAYLRQEAIDQQFELLLDSIQVSEDTQNLLLDSLRDSMKDKIEYHNTLVQQLEKQLKLLQGRLDGAYLDKLDGKISEEFWQSCTKKWTADKEELLIKLLALQKADTHYMDHATLILELAKKASRLFKNQNAGQKRRVIDLITSNCSYKDGKLDLELKPVFGLILESVKSENWCAQ